MPDNTDDELIDLPPPTGLDPVNKAFIVLALVVIALLASQVLGSFFAKKATPAFAQCLTQKGAVMFGTETCSFCKRQKTVFGDSFEFVTYVDCQEHRETCMNAGIRGYPTWIIGNTPYEGLQSISQLEKASGCSNS